MRTHAYATADRSRYVGLNNNDMQHTRCTAHAPMTTTTNLARVSIQYTIAKTAGVYAFRVQRVSCALMRVR